jgi:N-acetylmuramoyl-L-alanine amidase
VYGFAEPKSKPKFLLEMIKRTCKHALRNWMVADVSPSTCRSNLEELLQLEAVVCDAVKLKYRYAVELSAEFGISDRIRPALNGFDSMTTADVAEILRASGDEIYRDVCRACGLVWEHESAFFVPVSKHMTVFQDAQYLSEEDLNAQAKSDFQLDPFSYADVQRMTNPNDCSSARVEARLKVLIRDNEVADWAHLSADGSSLLIFSPTQREKEPEMRFQLAHLPTSLPVRRAGSGRLQERAPSDPNETPLAGWCIALNPSHIAGSLPASVAWQLEPNDHIRDNIFVGEVNLHIALVLRHMLQKHGAEVFLTRDEKFVPGDKTWQQWCDSAPPPKALRKWMITAKKVFHEILGEYQRRVLTPSDFVEAFQAKHLFTQVGYMSRARLINKRDPDIAVTVSILVPTEQICDQFLTLCIPGAFCKSEFDVPRERCDFARLALTGVIDKSLALGRSLWEHLSSTFTPYDPAVHTSSNVETWAVPVARDCAVWSRNLAVNRLVRRPNLFFQPHVAKSGQFIQDATNFSTDYDLGYSVLKTSKSIIAMADALCKGIILYRQRDQGASSS